MKKTKQKFAVNSKMILAILMPLLTLLFIESIYRELPLKVWIWMKEYPLNFIFEYLILFVCMNSFYFLKKRAYLFTQSLLFLIFSFFALASLVKTQKRGEPIVPSDFLLRNEALNISQYISIEGLFFTIGVLVVVTLIGLIVSFLLKKEKENTKVNVISSIISVIIACFLIVGYPFNLYSHFKIESIGWSQKVNSLTNGSVLGFVLNSINSSIKEPRSYTKETIDSILDSANSSKPTLNNAEKPNILFIQSEAFFDPTVLGQNVFNKDPLSYFHSLQKENTTGQMITPVYGGGTINTELEILTGLSTTFIPSVSLGFQNYINKPVNSAARIVRDQGYTATSIHTYHSWFYHRDELYKNLGFNSFQTRQTFKNAQLSDTTKFISDEEISKRIVQTLKETPTPDYIYSVTMENHGPYDHPKKQYNDYATNLQLEDGNRNILNTYAHNLVNIDHALKMLIESLKQLDEPTIVVFYGDHLPMLGDDMSVYKDANFIKNPEAKDDYIKMHTVPLLIWSNYLQKQPSIQLSSNFLTPYVFQLANIQMNTNFSFLANSINGNDPIILPSKFQKSSKETKKFLTNYELLQYDILKGKQFTYQNGNQVKDLPYFLGNPNFTVKNIAPKTLRVGESKQLITITGKGFSYATKVKVNDRNVALSSRSATKMQFFLSKKYYEQAGDITVEVYMSDSLKNVVEGPKQIIVVK
ncbi:LTA synthase family protein [Bacillus sp. JJ664]